MPKIIDWVECGPVVFLDAGDNMCRIPPVLDGFSDRCWRHLLSQQPPMYCVLKRQWVAKDGGTYGNFRCVSHKQCSVDVQCRLIGRSIGFFVRRDQCHAPEDRDIEGLTSRQWQIFVSSDSVTVEALALDYSRACVPAPGRRRLRELLGIGGEDLATKQAGYSTGALSAWLDGRRRDQLQQAGQLSPFKFVCAAFRGLAQEDHFSATFVTEQWFHTCAKLDKVPPSDSCCPHMGAWRGVVARECCRALRRRRAVSAVPLVSPRAFVHGLRCVGRPHMFCCLRQRLGWTCLQMVPVR